MHNYTTLPPVIANYCEPTKYMIPCHFISFHPIPGQSVLNNNGTRSYFGPNEWMSDCVAANSIPLCTTFPVFILSMGWGIFFEYSCVTYLYSMPTIRKMRWCGVAAMKFIRENTHNGLHFSPARATKHYLLWVGVDLMLIYSLHPQLFTKCKFILLSHPSIPR